MVEDGSYLVWDFDILPVFNLGTNFREPIWLFPMKIWDFENISKF